MFRRLWLGSSPAHLTEAQDALLRLFLPARLFEQERVRTFKTQRLNALEILPAPGTGHERTVVLAHGYGNGLGFFFRNFAGLASLPGTRVLAFDWLGWGLSERPYCHAAPRRANRWSLRSSKFDAPEEAEDFFIGSFDGWRREVMAPDEPFLLCGHSLGGFLCGKWAVRHASDSALRSLVLLSPAGLPEHPDDVVAPGGADPSGRRSPRLLTLVDCLWSRNFTPQMLLRAMGPRAWPNTLRRVRGRFRSAGLSEEESVALASYLFHISVAPASGEFALNSVLQPLISRTAGPQVFARLPLASPLKDELPAGLPVHVLFGDNDWLASRATLDTVRDLSASRGDSMDVSIVEDAGHYLHLEQPAATQRVLERQLAQVS